MAGAVVLDAVCVAAGVLAVGDPVLPPFGLMWCPVRAMPIPVPAAATTSARMRATITVRRRPPRFGGRLLGLGWAGQFGAGRFCAGRFCAGRGGWVAWKAAGTGVSAVGSKADSTGPVLAGRSWAALTGSGARQVCARIVWVAWTGWADVLVRLSSSSRALGRLPGSLARVTATSGRTSAGTEIRSGVACRIRNMMDSGVPVPNGGCPLAA